MKRTIAGMAFSLACLMNLSEAQTINHDKVEMENGKIRACATSYR